MEKTEVELMPDIERDESRHEQQRVDQRVVLPGDRALCRTADDQKEHEIKGCHLAQRAAAGHPDDGPQNKEDDDGFDHAIHG